LIQKFGLASSPKLVNLELRHGEKAAEELVLVQRRERVQRREQDRSGKKGKKERQIQKHVVFFCAV
jgi:hypothetical protein